MRKLLITGAALFALLGSALPAAASQSATSAPSRALVVRDTFIASTDGVRLHVHSVGGGPGARVAVFVHGGPGLAWQTLSFFDALAGPKLEVVGYDQRGAGESSSPADGNFALAAQVADLDAVRRWTGATRIAVVGHSWGGIPASVYTAVHPQRVSALVLLDAIPLDWAAFLKGIDNRNARVAALQAKGLIPAQLPPVRHDSCLAQVKALTPAYLAFPREQVSRTIWGPSCSESGAVAASVGFDRAVGRLPALADALGAWQGPALVIQGARDPFGLVWLRTSVAELNSPSTQRLVVPDAGHFPWIEKPNQVLSAVRTFLH
jgi:proline iminopeptidase